MVLKLEPYFLMLCCKFRGWKRNILFFSIQYSIFKHQYLIFSPQYSDFHIYLIYLYNYDLPHFSLFFYERCPLSQPTKTQCIPLQLVLPNGRGPSENIKLSTKLAPSYIAIDYYLLVNVGRKRLDLVTNIGPVWWH